MPAMTRMAMLLAIVASLCSSARGDALTQAKYLEGDWLFGAQENFKSTLWVQSEASADDARGAPSLVFRFCYFMQGLPPVHCRDSDHKMTAHYDALADAYLIPTSGDLPEQKGLTTANRVDLTNPDEILQYEYRPGVEGRITDLNPARGKRMR